MYNPMLIHLQRVRQAAHRRVLVSDDSRHLRSRRRLPGRPLKGPRGSRLAPQCKPTFFQMRRSPDELICALHGLSSP